MARSTETGCRSIRPRAGSREIPVVLERRTAAARRGSDTTGRGPRGARTSRPARASRPDNAGSNPQAQRSRVRCGICRARLVQAGSASRAGMTSRSNKAIDSWTAALGMTPAPTAQRT